jgi:hypothetical protein
MADIANTRAGGNNNNSTNDPRIIWEDGTWAIIEAGDCWDGLARSKTRDTIGDAHQATWDAGMTTMPGPQSIAAKKLVKVKFQDMLNNPPALPTPGNSLAPRKALPTPSSFQPPPSPAPSSPFSPKPWTGRNVPEFPQHCQFCNGWYYKGLDKTIHQSTENDPVLKGACPATAKQADKKRGIRA